MRVLKRLRPGVNGTKRLHREYGKLLVCVRYRYDSERGKRVKTIELVVDEWDEKPKVQKPHTIQKNVSPDEFVSKHAKHVLETEVEREKRRLARTRIVWFRFRGYVPELFRELSRHGLVRGGENYVWGLPWFKIEELGLFENRWLDFRSVGSS
jgi:hypothetical protein